MTTNTQSDRRLSSMNMLDTPGENAAMRALLLGICHIVSGGIEQVEGFNALLEDDIESNGGSTEYFAQISRELKTLRELANAANLAFPPLPDGIPASLSTVIDSVAERARREMPVGSTLETDLSAGLAYSGDVFTLQELLLDVLMRFSRSLSDSRKGWQVATRTFAASALPPHLVTDDSLTAAAAISAVAVLPSGIAFPSLKELRPFRETVNSSCLCPHPMLVTAKWIGAMLLNRGKCFYLPQLAEPTLVILFPEAAAEGAPVPRASTRRDGRKRTILLVDDEDMIWDVLIDMLQDMGYNVLLAGDGKEAVSIYGSNPGGIDLVILDMLMPNMGGKETFFILKELDPDVRVLASSGYVSQEEIQDVMDAGAAGFLRKPYRMVELSRKIDEIFSNNP